jgi:hypothetical protein
LFGSSAPDIYAGNEVKWLKHGCACTETEAGGGDCDVGGTLFTRIGLGDQGPVIERTVQGPYADAGTMVLDERRGVFYVYVSVANLVEVRDRMTAAGLTFVATGDSTPHRLTFQVR